MVETALNWARKHRYEAVLFALVILLAAFFRFYRLDEYMTFLGDEGRDALVVKGILTGQHFPAVGPPMSVGNVYLGPLYYYMMAVAMAIFWLSPVAAAGMVALIGLASVVLIYYLARQWFGVLAALVASLLYAVSPVVVTYSRFSWNPNPVPFFTLLSIFGLYQAHRSRDFRWFILTGASLAAAIQMHYLALILVPVIGLLWIYELGLKLRGKLKRGYFWTASLVALSVFLLLMSPVLFFDIRHNFLNSRGLYELFFSGREGVRLTFLDTLARTIPLYLFGLAGKYLAGGNETTSILVGLSALTVLAHGFRLKLKGERLSWPVLALTVWLGLGLAGLMFYKGKIYDHYLGVLSPIPFILFGAFYQAIAASKTFKTPALVLGAVLLAVVLFANLSQNPLFFSPNRQLQRTQDIARFIISQSGGKPYNFALLAERNYDSAYQYYLDLYGHKPQPVPFEKTDQLFVVCEDAKCEPVGNPKYEIAAFGWSQVGAVYEVDGLQIFKLIPNPAQPNR